MVIFLDLYFCYDEEASDEESEETSTEEAENEVSEESVELLFASFRYGGAQAPDDGEDEDSLQGDGVHLGLVLLHASHVNDCGEYPGEGREKVKLAISNVKWAVFDQFETSRNQPFKHVAQQALLFFTE